MAWPQDKKAYDPYTDPKLTKNQGGIDTIKGIDNAARSALMSTPGAKVASAGIGMVKDAAMALPNKIKADNANQKDAVNGYPQRNAGYTAAANVLQSGTQQPRLWMPDSLKPNPQVMGIAKPLVDPRQNGDPRFDAMRKGIAGVSNIGADKVFGEDARTGATITKDFSGRPQAVPFGQRSSMGAVGGTMRDEQTGETISMGQNGAINRFGADGQAIAKLSGRNWGRPESNGIGQNYSNGGLNVQFDANAPASERQAFTTSHSAIAGQRAKDEQLAQSQTAARAALNGGRGPGLAMPVMPDMRGMNLDQRKSAIDAFQAEQNARNSFQQNSISAQNYDANNANQKDQNRINEDRNKVMGIGDRADGQIKQYGLDRQKLMDGILEASANAIPGTVEGDKVIADSRRRWSEMNPPKEVPDSVMALNTYTEGQIDGQRLVNKKDGSPVGGEQREAEAIPADKTKLISGKQYAAPDGSILIWNGKAFDRESK